MFDHLPKEPQELAQELEELLQHQDSPAVYHAWLRERGSTLLDILHDYKELKDAAR